MGLGSSDVFVGKYRDWTSTSIQPESIEFESTLLFPNPSTGLYQMAGGDGLEYRIFDSMGKLVEQGEVENKHVIDLTANPSGVYYVHIITEKGTSTQMLLKK